MPGYVMTARRKAALRKAQLASARKRRNRRRKVIAGGVLAGIGGLAYARHVVSGSYVSAAVGHRMGPASVGQRNVQYKKEQHGPRTRRVLNVYAGNHIYGVAYHRIGLKDRNPGFRTMMLRNKKIYNLEGKMVKVEQKFFRRAIRQDIQSLNRKNK